MPERKRAVPPKKAAARKTASKKATAQRPKAAPKKAATAQTAAPPARAVVELTTPATGAEVCPRCGTEKFGPEERIRAEGSRTVRFTVLVCERGHTFARPVAR